MQKEWKQLKCSVCGGELQDHDDKLVCQYCRAIYECIEHISEDEVIQLNQATVQRTRLLFDDAYERYELILNTYPNNSEAAWGAFLCSYGIIYTQDYDGTYKPTCHRLNECPVEESYYYAKLSNDKKERAKEIEILRQNILAQANSIPPYDVFICYKATDDWFGRSVPTKESTWARDIYEMLTNSLGLKVFFAEKCLSGNNTDYEPHIYSALRSSKMMLVLANSLDHVNAVWVQNEWRRYAQYIREGQNKTLRVIIDEIEPYHLPRVLQAKQAINHNSMNWGKEVKDSVEQIFKKEEPKQSAQEKELESLRKQIEELKKTQTLQTQPTQTEKPANPTPAPTTQPTKAVEQPKQTTPTPTVTASETKQPTQPKPTPTDPDFEIKDGVLVKYKGKGEKVIIPNTVTKIGKNAFICSTLNSVVIPNTVISIDDGAFGECHGLTSVVIPNSVTSIGNNVFASCNKLTNIKVDNNNKNYKDINGNLYTKDGKTLVQYAIGKTETSFTIPNSVTSIRPFTFYNCENLTDIAIPNSLTTISPGAFANIKNLTRVVIPNTVTSIGESAFMYCEELTSVEIPNSVTTVGKKAFAWCNNLSINAEAKEKPQDWHDEWNSDDRPVVWGYKTEKIFLQGLDFYNKKDYTNAAKYFQQSANQGHAKAQYNLGICYQHGKGVTQSYSNAIMWYKKAKDQGIAQATQRIKEIESVTQSTSIGSFFNSTSPKYR